MYLMDVLYLISLIFAGYTLAYSWDSSNGEYEKRQLVPLPRIGRSYSEEKRQGLIPSPRVGRSSPSNGIDISCALNLKLCHKVLDYLNLHEVHDGSPFLNSPLLAARRKRSTIADDYTNDLSDDDFELIKTLRSNTWDIDVKNENLFQRNARQLIPAPRVGRSGHKSHNNHIQLLSGYSNSDDNDMMVDPIDLQLRAAFIPRLGKRTTYKPIDRLSDSDDTYKRAASFTPRIGRAAFTPRIGKRASFVPRIGRSVNKLDKH
ncbi:uncharacterized protein LOC128962405 [Oppia nitens]|uniref:uncharacterized protein LOC128962405 n=1 Tax=Oppia nitens TaxID=1686743 RepID=UPI0023DA683D|nr:uncharacterized protein LOC128962405 [Oppia nitens]